MLGYVLQVLCAYRLLFDARTANPLVVEVEEVCNTLLVYEVMIWL